MPIRPNTLATLRQALALVALGASAVLYAQQPPVDPTAVPVEREPQHRLVFANAFVRVIDAYFPPLYVTQYHSHAADNVAVTILPGRDDAQGAARIGFAGFSRGGYSHVATNPNTLPMRFIDVELLGADHGEGGDDEVLTDHEVVLNNGRVRVMRVRLDAGRGIPVHRHSGGYVSIVVRGAEAAGTWRWHAASEGEAAIEAGRQALDVVEVEPR